MTPERLVNAAKNADWMTVVLNQGPPCFHYEADTGTFCLRAQRWPGHVDGGEYPEHTFVSLDALLLSLVASLTQERDTLKQAISDDAGQPIDYYVNLVKCGRDDSELLDQCDQHADGPTLREVIIGLRRQVAAQDAELARLRALDDVHALLEDVERLRVQETTHV